MHGRAIFIVGFRVSGLQVVVKRLLRQVMSFQAWKQQRQQLVFVPTEAVECCSLGWWSLLFYYVVRWCSVVNSTINVSSGNDFYHPFRIACYFVVILVGFLIVGPTTV